MAGTIVADTIQAAATSTLLIQTGNGAPTTAISIDPTQKVTLPVGIDGDLKFNSGYGSVATAYGCRAWVNFNGAGTVAIRASGNVSSITDNGTGDYTVNFTTAMPDANYAVNLMGNVDAVSNYGFSFAAPYSATPTTSAIRLAVSNPGTRVDAAFVFAAIFR
jgi:uncharacterized protein (AIM24 family)